MPGKIPYPVEMILKQFCVLLATIYVTVQPTAMAASFQDQALAPALTATPRESLNLGAKIKVIRMLIKDLHQVGLDIEGIPWVTSQRALLLRLMMPVSWTLETLMGGIYPRVNSEILALDLNIIEHRLQESSKPFLLEEATVDNVQAWSVRLLPVEQEVIQLLQNLGLFYIRDIYSAFGEDIMQQLLSDSGHLLQRGNFGREIAQAISQATILGNRAIMRVNLLSLLGNSFNGISTSPILLADAYFLVGGPEIHPYLKFASEWAKTHSDPRQRGLIVLIGGRSSATPLLVEQTRRYYEGRLSQADDKFLQNALRSISRVMDADIIEFILNKEGIALHSMRKPVNGLSLEQSLEAAVKILGTDFRMKNPIYKRTIAFVSSPVILPQLMKNARAIWTKQPFGQLNVWSVDPLQADLLSEEDFLGLLFYLAQTAPDIFPFLTSCLDAYLKISGWVRGESTNSLHIPRINDQQIRGSMSDHALKRWGFLNEVSA